MCGKYIDLSDSLQVAQRGAAPRRHPQPRAGQDRIRRLRDAERRRTSTSWRASTRSWCPAASASAASKARSCAARYAREHKIPYLGICLGMQVATIEFARHVAGLADANSTEFDPDTPHPVIALIDEWQDRDGTIQKRDAQLRPRRHDAPGRAELRRASPARWRTRSTATWSPSATATATRPTSTTSSGCARPGW